MKITSRAPRFLKKSKIGPKKNSLHFSILAKNITSQKHGQIVPTPSGSISHHTKPSQKPYNATNRFLAISSNIPYYSYYSYRRLVIRIGQRAKPLPHAFRLAHGCPWPAVSAAAAASAVAGLEMHRHLLQL